MNMRILLFLLSVFGSVALMPVALSLRFPLIPLDPVPICEQPGMCSPYVPAATTTAPGMR